MNPIDIATFRAAIRRASQHPSPHGAVFAALGEVLSPLSQIAIMLQDLAAEPTPPRPASHSRQPPPLEAIVSLTLQLREAIQNALIDLHETGLTAPAAADKPPHVIELPLEVFLHIVASLPSTIKPAAQAPPPDAASGGNGTKPS